MDRFSRLRASIPALLILGVVFYAGMYVGSENVAHSQRVVDVTDKSVGQPDDLDFEEFWRAWNIIDEYYVAPTATSTLTDVDRLHGAISGLAASLEDPYTTFLPPEDSKIFKDDISGNFEGVGMEISIREGILTVVSPLEGSPAKQAGIKAGDSIIRIDETSTSNMSVDEGVKLIRGEKGTVVSLTVVRDGEEQPLVIDVTRDVIDIPSVESELRDDGVFVVRLFNFSEDSVNAFRSAIRGFILSGSTELVLDLRGNPGGFLGAAVDMASWFLPMGKVVVEEDFGSDVETRSHRSRGYNVFGPDLEMVILIDRGSASAAEILAGALREHNVATLVGTQTFGKGSVQQLESVAGGSLKITVARWLTPNGTSISQNGLTPDVVVEYGTEEDPFRDTQLERAVELLKGL